MRHHYLVINYINFPDILPNTLVHNRMNARKRTVAGWIIIVLILCQFVPLDRIAPPSSNRDSLPADVEPVLKNRCFNCHSNETHWPKTAYIAPLSWLVVHEIGQARLALNFSEHREPAGSAYALQTNKIHKLIVSGKISSHAHIPGFAPVSLNGQERSILLRWSEESETEPRQGAKNSGRTLLDKNSE